MIVNAVLTSLLLASAPTKLAAPGFDLIDVDRRRGEFAAQFFVQQLAREGQFAIIAPDQVAATLGLARQRQLLGCGDEDNSCIAEIAGALNVDALVLGSIAKVPDGYAVTVKVSSARNGTTLAGAGSRIDGDERELLDWLSTAAGSIARSLRDPASPTASVVSTEPQHRIEVSAPFVSLEYSYRIAPKLWVAIRGGAQWGISPPYRGPSGTARGDVGYFGSSRNYVGAVLMRHRSTARLGWGWGAFGGLQGGFTQVRDRDLSRYLGPGLVLGVEGGVAGARVGVEAHLHWPGFFTGTGSFATGPSLVLLPTVSYGVSF
jgi:hypothetical protein